ncbi:MAG: aminotransferase class I/II-fold pyridoxal phosphate-dependent enzyme [Nannocystaceae bacterium]
MRQQTHSAYDTVDQVITDGVARGLAHLSTEDDAFDGRTLRVDGRALLNFASGSYLALERHPALIDGARAALRRFGTQFAASRAYISIGLYDELEANLRRIFDRPAVAAASTTLGHLSALPVLIRDRDAVVLDHQVHSSVQMAAQLLKARGVPIYMIRHNRMDQLEGLVQRLRGRHDRIWYLADGIYSMHGDTAPIAELVALQERYPALWSYVDDAHGFGWHGRHGRGWIAERVPSHPRMVLAVSLQKSYASGGGVIVLPDEELARRVRTCGPTLIFSGPIQPPMLGSATAASRLHLSEEIVPLQRELAALIRYCNDGLADRGLPQLSANDTPLFFVPTGLPRLVYKIADRLMGDGCCVNMGCFPAVPMSQGGLRFHVHRGLRRADVDRLLDRMRRHYVDVLAEEGVSADDLARTFRAPALAALDLSPRTRADRRRAPSGAGLRLREHDRIDAIPAARWDALFADRGPMTHAALAALEPALCGAPRGTSAADPRYLMIDDRDGRPVLATFYAITTMKDDMLASAEVSAKVEAIRRERDPSFLISRAIVMGNPISLGGHLYLDRAHPAWREALALLAGRLREVKREASAGQVLLREFARGADDELREVLLDLGFVEVALPDMMTIENATWTDRAGHLASLTSRYRGDLRREFLPAMDGLRVEDGPIDDPRVLRACYRLYREVAARGLRMNVLPLPEAAFAAMAACPEFDVVRLYERGEAAPTRPAAVLISHRSGERCTALLVGFDRAHVRSHNVYKVGLLHMVERARAQGATTINLAYTAELVKKKLGARPRPTAAFVMVDDTYAASVLATL